MKKFWLLLGLFFLFGCSESDKTILKTFELSNKIHQISVTGRGLNTFDDNEKVIKEIVFDNVSVIQKVDEAIQNATELKGNITSEGPIFVLE